MVKQNDRRGWYMCGLWLFACSVVCASNTASKALDDPPIAQVEPPVAVNIFPPIPQVERHVAPQPKKVELQHPAGAIKFDDGRWYKPHPTIAGHYTPCAESEVSASNRPFSRNPAVVCGITSATTAPHVVQPSITYPGTTGMVHTTIPVHGAAQLGNTNCVSGFG